MRLHEIARVERGPVVRLSGWVTRETDSRPTEIYFEFPAAFGDWVPESADPFAIALLVPALMGHESLVIAPPISPLLHRHLPEVRDVFVHWYPEMRPAAIEAQRGPARMPAAEPRAATFFSGGVDSFYTLLKRTGPAPLPEPLTHLIYMRGIETPLAESSGTDDALARIRDVAAELGVRVIAGETNLRTFFTRHWERYYFGSGLAATAAALSGGLSTVCIPSGRSYSNLTAEGSTPVTDPMLATEACRIVHDGGELTRADKLRVALQLAPATVRAHLRVCMANQGGPTNCGACYKCVRTMVVLDILGELDRCELFRHVDRSNWNRWLLADHHDFNVEALAFARRHGASRTITRLLQSVVDRRERFDAAVRLVKHSPLVRILPLLQTVRDRLGVSPRVHRS